MRAIGVRDLKANLSRYLREVERGEIVLVTDRGRVVAELRAASGSARPESDVERGLRLLAARTPLLLREPHDPDRLRGLAPPRERGHGSRAARRRARRAVIVYAESSAVLAWLLGEPGGEAVRQALAAAERVVASALTPLECQRALARGAATGQLPKAEAGAAARLLATASAGWALMEMTGPALDRARVEFPSEPVRTLDAVHLAAALEFRQALGAVTLLSLDQRIRANASPLGLTAAP